MRKIRLLIGASLLVLLLLALPACGSTEDAAPSEEPAQTEEAAQTEEDTAVPYTNDGMNLNIPGEYDGLLKVETPRGDEGGVLFMVSEQASIDAAEASGQETEGAGWLFSIGRIDEKKLHEFLTGEMSGVQPFAKDADGNYYVYYHPTDVRLIRADNQEMEAATEEWAKLNEWAATMPAEFIADNSGLTEEKYGNTELDIQLARIAYTEGEKYTLTSTEAGEMQPGDVDPKPYVEKLMNGVTYEEADLSEAPDGEYIVLNFPEMDMRFDFFTGDKNCIRQVWADGENEKFYRAVFEDDSLTSTDVMQDWYHALADAQ